MKKLNSRDLTQLISIQKMAYNTLSLSKGIEESDIISSMSRLNDDYEGVIKINDFDIKEFSPKSLRNTIAFCTKEIPWLGEQFMKQLQNIDLIK